MRPLYETVEDLDNEVSAASVFERRWNCSMHKLSIKYQLDFVAKRGQKAVAFCEIKTRNYTMQRIKELGGYLMSLGKWNAAKQLYDCTGLPFILIVRTTDGLWYSVYKDFKPDDVLVRGRTDRNDWQDIEPCVLLDVNKFIKMDGDNE